MTPAQILELPLPARAQADSGATTVRGYLVALVEAMWGDPAGNVDSKRPFGSSSWRNDLYRSLIDAGVIDGAYDPDGYLERVDTEAGGRVIREAIAALAPPPPVLVVWDTEGTRVTGPAGQDPEDTARALIAGLLDQMDPAAALRVAAWAGERWAGPEDGSRG